MFKFYRQLTAKCLSALSKRPQLRSYATQQPRGNNPFEEATRKKNLRSTLYYVTAGGVLVVGLSYAAVPLYRMFCQVRGII